MIEGKPTQGGSTITQQLVKNDLEAQDNRTVFEKLREAALAWHLTRRWSKKQILTDYLNTIYFGNGAYGIEAAARTYFGADPRYANCGASPTKPCAKLLTPADSASAGWDHRVADRVRPGQHRRRRGAEEAQPRAAQHAPAGQSQPRDVQGCDRPATVVGQARAAEAEPTRRRTSPTGSATG